MNPFEFVVVIVAIGTVGSVVKTLINAIGGRRGGVDPKQLHAIDDRLARIEQAVDAMAVEVERISEGQRFTTKLLADRAKRESVPGLQ